MRRPSLVIASSSRVDTQVVALVVESFLPTDDTPHRVDTLVYRCAADLFECLEKKEAAELLDTVVLVDLTGEAASSAELWNVGQRGTQLGFAAELVLRFPEVYPIFLAMPREQVDEVRQLLFEPPNSAVDADERRALDERWRVLATHHFPDASSLAAVRDLLRAHARGFRVLYDCTGLRSALKNRLFAFWFNEDSNIYSSFVESRAKSVAVVLDEEKAFVELNAYAAFKAGLRAWVLPTNGECRRVLGRDWSPFTTPLAPERFDVALSDWDFKYADLERDEVRRSTSLVAPGPDCPLRVRSVDAWYVITSYREQVQRQAPEYIVEVKPYGGLFRLLAPGPRAGPRHDKLAEVFQANWGELGRRDATVGASRSQANSTRASHHSAPYACTQIAGALLQRARLINQDSDGSTARWVQVAVLATEAKEILGGLSHTMAYECLALANEAEVNAEASFLGMAAAIDVTERLSRLHKEAEALRRATPGATGLGLLTRFLRGGPRPADDARQDEDREINFLIQTVGNLRIRLREYDQFDAADACLAQISWYEYKTQRRLLQRWAQGYLLVTTNAGTSFSRLLVASAIWIVFFALWYALLFAWHPSLSSLPALGLGHAVAHSAALFLGREAAVTIPADAPASAWRVSYLIASLAEYLVSYLHLGLLIAVLYRRLIKDT